MIRCLGFLVSSRDLFTLTVVEQGEEGIPPTHEYVLGDGVSSYCYQADHPMMVYHLMAVVNSLLQSQPGQPYLTWKKPG